MGIRLLVASDADAFFRLRLTALDSHPTAFATGAAAWRAAPHSAWQHMAERSADASDETFAIIGAFEGDELIGLVGLQAQPKPAVRHKASIWGLYVQGEHRNVRVGSALVDAALELSTTWAHVRTVRIVVSTDSVSALSVFQRLGFESYGLEPEARFIEGQYVDQMYLRCVLADRPALARAGLRNAP